MAPFEIPGNTTVELECYVDESLRSGPFAGQIHLFVADPHLREVVLTVRGQFQGNEPDGKGSGFAP